MTDQNSSAQAIVQAFDDRYELCGPFDDDWQEQCLAAALREVANQVAPYMEIRPQENLESRRDAMEWGMNQQTQVLRQKILEIANELEKHNV